MSKMSSLSPSENEFSKKLRKIIEENLTNQQFGVSMLARELGMSRSNLHRKVRSIANLSVSQYIRQVRLNFAMEMLCQSTLSCSEVAYNVGFGSVTYFNKCFHDFFGFTPGEASNRDLNESISKGELTQKRKPIRNKKKLYSIATVFILIVLFQAILIYFVFKPFSIWQNKDDKSIAVLPITDYSEEEGQTWILNGIREDLISKLEIIEGLNVISRSTSDKFKNYDPGNIQNFKGRKVDYMLIGSGEKINDKINIRFQLIETVSGKNLWPEPFERKITLDNIIQFQEEVTLLVANELNSIVTKKEREQITLPKTENIAAYNFFLQGRSFMKIQEKMQYSIHEIIEGKDFNPLEMAKSNFQKALVLDSTYSQVYVSLGWYYHSKSEIHIFDAYKSNNYLDSALFMAEKAISFDPNYADAYDLQSCILAHKGMVLDSEKSADKLININKSDWKAYLRIADNYYLMNNYSRAIRYYLLARRFNKEPIEDTRILRGLYYTMVQSGYAENAKPFLELLLNQENDSVEYYNSLSNTEFSLGNLSQALIYQLKTYSLDTLVTQRLLQLSVINMSLLKQGKMLYYFDKYHSKIQQNYTNIAPSKYAGYIYLALGNENESNYHFNQVIENNIIRIELGTYNHYSYSSEYELACVYSVKGEINRALDYLQYYKKKSTCPLWLITSLKLNPMLENIRETSDFKDVLKDLEYKYLKEHDKTKEILISEGIFQPKIDLKNFILSNNN